MPDGKPNPTIPSNRSARSLTYSIVGAFGPRSATSFYIEWVGGGETIIPALRSRNTSSARRWTVTFQRIRIGAVKSLTGCRDPAPKARPSTLILLAQVAIKPTSFQNDIKPRAGEPASSLRATKVRPVLSTRGSCKSRFPF